MNEQREEKVTVVNADETSARDEMALRKVARAVLAIARRQLHQEAQEVDDAEA